MHELDIFLDHLDAVHPFIHFTVKKELNIKLLFLDITI